MQARKVFRTLDNNLSQKFKLCDYFYRLKNKSLAKSLAIKWLNFKKYTHETLTKENPACIILWISEQILPFNFVNI